jgi:hypothetical protein
VTSSCTNRSPFPRYSPSWKRRSTVTLGCTINVVNTLAHDTSVLPHNLLIRCHSVRLFLRIVQRSARNAEFARLCDVSGRHGGRSVSTMQGTRSPTRQDVRPHLIQCGHSTDGKRKARNRTCRLVRRAIAQARRR